LSYFRGMKILKFTFLFFVVFSIFLLASCNPKDELQSSKNSELDSISFFMQEMKNDKIDFKTRLKQANSAFQKIGNNKFDSRIKEILAYKIYLYGYLKQLDSAINISKELVQISIKNNDSVAIGNNYYRLAYYYFQSDKKDSAFITNKLC